MTQLLSSLAHFNILQDCDLEWITTSFQPKSYPHGRQLIEEGIVPDTLYLALNANLALKLPQFDGDNQDFIPLSAGSLIGEALMLDGHASSYTVETIEAAEVLVISKQTLISKVERDRGFAARFYHLLAIKLSERLRQLSTIMAKRQIKEGEPLRKVLMVFATLNDSDVSWLLAHGTAEKSSLGSGLIQQGQSVPAIYLLLEGVLGVYISIDQNGTSQEIEVAKRVKGDILGEMSFVDGGTASATVKSLENAWFLAVPQATLAAKLQEDVGFASRFYRAIAQILSTRCHDLLVRGGSATTDITSTLSDDIEVEDELDLDVLDGTAIAGSRFDWIIHQLRR